MWAREIITREREMKAVLSLCIAIFAISTNAFWGTKIKDQNCNITIKTDLGKEASEELEYRLHNKGFFVVAAEDVNEENKVMSLELRMEKDFKRRTRKVRHVNTFVIHRSELSDFKHRYNGKVRISKRRHVNFRHGYIYVELSSYIDKTETVATYCKVKSVYKNSDNAVVEIMESDVKIKHENVRCNTRKVQIAKEIKLPKCRLK
tara:strand:+ start:30304 stop:30918 length:615 start_codon:yes stop_codon:yes gene_type:complete